MNYLIHYTEKAQTALFQETGSFFAFSQKQFNEQSKQDVKYTSVGAGLICPSENVKKLLDGLEEINKKGVKLDVAENGPDAIIRREYFNYETQISRDRSEAIEALESYREIYPDQFTDEKIKTVMDACWKEAIENDMF